MKTAISLTERGLVPEPLVRFGIDQLLQKRLAERPYRNSAERQRYTEELLAGLAEHPVATHTDIANQQHYEVPAAFYRLVLGRHLKYSGSLWDKGVTSLSIAEEAMLNRYVDTAQVEDGMTILDLGCGWGSLSLFLARRFPNAKITAVSNSNTQRQTINDRATAEGLHNLQVITQDVNTLSFDETFDRILSVEMLEHVRNHKTLLHRMAGWLNPDGKLFVHVFCHRDYCYLFETDGEDDWMGRNFFTGGIMPSEDLLPKLAEDFKIEEQQFINGTHYQKTAEAWHSNLIDNRQAVMPILLATYGESEATRWYHRWKIFFLSCAQLFGTHQGNEWGVAHYRFALKENHDR